MKKKEINIVKTLTAGFLIFFIMVSVFTPFAHAEKDIKNYNEEEIIEIAEDIINWKKSNISVDKESYLINNDFLQNAGDTSGDWYPIGIGRIGYPDDYSAYLAVIADKVSQRYLEDEKLSSNKASEWHRISLAILSMGGDPTNIGKDSEGNSIDLIEDGTYNRGNNSSLGAQGINGWLWGLITLDSMRYEIPEDGFYTRDDIITEIIELQLEDGGFSLDGNESDPDITGMTIQALAPYYNSEQEYNYYQKSLDQDVKKKVRDVVDKALEYLSRIQSLSGGYTSWDMENVESSVQVLVALTSLGIDPTADARFIKEGKTILDSIMSFQREDGGFIHSKVQDPDNPSASPDESNSMASEQVLYSLASLLRYKGNYRSLYDFRPEMNNEIKDKVDSVKDSISNLSEPFKKEEVEKVFSEYMEIPIVERNYVYNYKVLSDAMETLDIENTSEYLSSNIGLNAKGKGTITLIFDREIEFEEHILLVEEDLNNFKSLPEELTTEYYVEVLKLIQKIEGSENKGDYIDTLDELYLMKDEIKVIQEEIDSINEDILDQLYPFQSISIKDRKNVDSIIERFNKLSDYDKNKIVEYEDVVRSKTKIDNQIRAGVISIMIIIIVIVLAIIIRCRMKKRKIEKMKDKMLFFDDDEEV